MTENKRVSIAHRQISDGRRKTKLQYFILLNGHSYRDFHLVPMEKTVGFLPVIKDVYSWKIKNNHGINLWSHWTDRPTARTSQTKTPSFIKNLHSVQTFVKYKNPDIVTIQKQFHKPLKCFYTFPIFILLHIYYPVKCLISSVKI